ncbi:MAG: alpha/beta hydrolase-fold protein [Clostridia bacterium]|jgi:predicted peptidase|nr:alpha/beta hydrolase-fold protein [Clostridia bacterium]MCI2000198.1 alpha/beta hydrolase-fold protein [Clostridia bacterium]MCI2014637.1 alpha/beta hydrolase-fold protein [Clostridia bacterium]
MAELLSLIASDITFTGNSLKPAFKSNITDYKFNVQSDVYGVRLYADAADGTDIFINGKKAEKNKPVLIELSQDYADYDIEYRVRAEIKAVCGNDVKKYNVEIIRENDTKTYNLFKSYVFDDENTFTKMPYEVYVPSNYDSKKKYPLVYVLHGAGQRLQSVDMVLKRYQSATIWAKDSEKGINECIVVSPQCAEANGIGWTYFMTILDKNEYADPFKFTNWGLTAYDLLQAIKADYNIDTDRIYLTGMSMGGFGTFEMAIEHPDEFAAIVPVCGGGNPEKIIALKGLPIWMFHAVDDPLVDYKKWSVPTMKAFDNAKIDYTKTIYDADTVFWPSGHFSWTPAYANKDMRDWLFKQKKNK